MKIGLDIHGTITDNLEFFKNLASAIVSNPIGEVHILSGPSEEKIQKELDDMGFIRGTHYNYIFSITDYQLSLGNKIEFDNIGNPFIEPYLWDKSKADYCLYNKIDLMIDDSDAYGYFFKTPYARFYSKNKRKHYVKE